MKKLNFYLKGVEEKMRKRKKLGIFTLIIVVMFSWIKRDLNYKRNEVEKAKEVVWKFYGSIKGANLNKDKIGEYIDLDAIYQKEGVFHPLILQRMFDNSSQKTVDKAIYKKVDGIKKAKVNIVNREGIAFNVTSVDSFILEDKGEGYKIVDYSYPGRDKYTIYEKLYDRKEEKAPLTELDKERLNPEIKKGNRVVERRINGVEVPVDSYDVKGRVLEKFSTDGKLEKKYRYEDNLLAEEWIYVVDEEQDYKEHNENPLLERRLAYTYNYKGLRKNQKTYMFNEEKVEEMIEEQKWHYTYYDTGEVKGEYNYIYYYPIDGKVLFSKYSYKIYDDARKSEKIIVRNKEGLIEQELSFYNSKGTIYSDYGQNGQVTTERSIYSELEDYIEYEYDENDFMVEKRDYRGGGEVEVEEYTWSGKGGYRRKDYGEMSEREKVVKSVYEWDKKDNEQIYVNDYYIGDQESIRKMNDMRLDKFDNYLSEIIPYKYYEETNTVVIETSWYKLIKRYDSKDLLISQERIRENGEKEMSYYYYDLKGNLLKIESHSKRMQRTQIYSFD